MAKQRLLGGLGCAVIVLGLMAVQPALTADTTKGNAEPAAEKAAAKKPVQLRLPAHYGKIVDEKQRERIYAIQKEYGPKIQELKAQLQVLMDQRDQKIEAVLTPEQRKELATIKEAAKAKRKKAVATKKDGAEPQAAKADAVK
ncbi:MAG: hypothetical protein JW809_00830 [Pirellulales bacterium]|nr:hypothetical protein [Pirellulales bacterium]